MKKFVDFLKDEEGASMVEYGVLVALIAAISILVITAVGGKVSDAFEDVNEAL